MNQHIRDAADAVIRGLGDYPALIDDLTAREFLADLKKRSAADFYTVVRESLGEVSDAHLLTLYRLAIEIGDDGLAGKYVTRMITDYAVRLIANRHLEWPTEGECDEHMAADNRERVRAVMEVRRA